jgi:hypothetical protein
LDKIINNLVTNNGKELAMKAMLEKEKLNYLSAQRLISIKRLFYGRT